MKQHFFQLIKSRLPPADSYHASHVMTDDASQYYNAWIAVFGPADTMTARRHVLSMYHVHRLHVPERDNQVEIYHMLRCLLQEPNEDDFKCCLSAFMQHIDKVAVTALKSPASELLPHATKLISEKWQKSWNNCTSNKLQSINPTIGVYQHVRSLSRCDAMNILFTR